MKLEEAIKTKGFKNQRQKAVVNLMYTAYQVKSHLGQVLKQHGITHEQYNVLRILKGSHPTSLCVRDIATRTVERNSNVPRIIDRLEAKELVKRNVSPEDRRETLITVTPAGLTLLEAANAELEREESAFVALTEAQATTLNNLLEAFMQE